MKLIAIPESKLESFLALLGPLSKRLENDPDEDTMAQLADFQRYFREKIETGVEIQTPSSIGRKGGCSKSRKKLDAVRQNAKKAGPPGNYYARLIVSCENEALPLQAIHYYFSTKKERDSWLTGPGKREPLRAVNRNIRSLKHEVAPINQAKIIEC